MILEIMTSNDFRLVDNTDFLMWATEETLPRLRDSTRMVLIRQDGAEYIEDRDDLVEALDAILTERYDKGLEFQIAALPAPGLPVDTCSRETQFQNE